MTNEDKPLTAEVERGCLVMRIGVDRLAESFYESEQNNPFDHDRGVFFRRLCITNALEFARDVAAAMKDEEENGATPLTDFLDSACEAAVNAGSAWVEREKV